MALCFKLIWRMDKILCAPTSPWSPNREQNQASKLLIIKKKKWNSTYLIHIYILLTNTVREVRRNSKEICQFVIGTSRIKVTVINCFPIPIHTVLCRHYKPANVDEIPAIVSWPLMAREMPWLTKLKLIFSLNDRSS